MLLVKYSVYSLIFFCICACVNSSGVSRAKKVVSLSSEEIIRRRNVAESYSAQISAEQKDWIDTYYGSLPNNVQRKFPSQDEMYVSSENSMAGKHGYLHTVEKSVKMYESIFNREISKNPTKISENNIKINLEEFERRRDIYTTFYPNLIKLELDRYSPKNPHARKGSAANIEKPKTNVLKDKVDTGNTVDYPVVGESSRIERDNNKKLSVRNNTEENADSDNFKTFIESLIHREDISISLAEWLLKSDVGDRETILSDLSKFIEEKQVSKKESRNSVFSGDNIMGADVPLSSSDFMHNEKDKSNDILSNNNNFDSVGSPSNVKQTKNDHSKVDQFRNPDYNVNNEEIKGHISASNVEPALTEKAHSVASNKFSKSHCFLCDDKNIVYGNCIKLTYSICQAKYVFMKEQLHQSYSSMDSAESHHKNYKAYEHKICSINEGALNNEKNIGVKEDDHSLSREVKEVEETCVFTEKFKNTKEEDYSFLDPELYRRQKTYTSYMSELHRQQKKWIETYHFSLPESDLLNTEYSNEFVGKNSPTEHASFKNIVKKQKCVQEGYVLRWVNQLKKKYKESVRGYGSFLFKNTLSFPVSANLWNNLDKLSRNFDIAMLDKFISDLISNSTLHNNYVDNFDISYMLSDPWYQKMLGAALLLLIIFYYKVSLFGLIIILTFLCHGYKLYQQKLAEKHSIVSSVPSEYCESILKTESGFVAHIKEYFRWWWYDEECKKYYEAVMVDASAEISVPVIMSNLVSETLFEILSPFGRKMNVFFRHLTHNLSFSQQLFIVILVVVVFGFCILLISIQQQYRIRLPFFLGTVEPAALTGSKVEDVVLEKEKCFLKNSQTKSDALTVKEVNISKEKSLYVAERKHINLPSSRTELTIILPETHGRCHCRHSSF